MGQIQPISNQEVFFSYIVPENDGCLSLPPGSKLFISPCRDGEAYSEGIHLLENTKTGLRVARWIYPGSNRIFARKYNGSNIDSEMVIDITAADCEWRSLGKARYQITTFNKP